jgi:hypothetical protein
MVLDPSQTATRPMEKMRKDKTSFPVITPSDNTPTILSISGIAMTAMRNPLSLTFSTNVVLVSKVKHNPAIS